MTESSDLHVGNDMQTVKARLLSRPVTARPKNLTPPEVDPWTRVVPKESPYHNVTLDNYIATTDEQQRVLAGVIEYASDVKARLRKRTNAVWFGSVGTGKDHLAIGVLRRAVEAGMQAKVVYGETFRARTRDVIMSDDEREERFLAGFVQHFLLFSDPIPVLGQLTPTQSDALMAVIRNRIERGLPTLVTINVLNRYEERTNKRISRARDEAERLMGLPTWDRITEGAYVFECQWPSYRKHERFFK